MQHMEYREGRAMLRKAGFSEEEIKRLSRLRTAYREEGSQPQASPGRHWFARAMQKLGGLCFQLTYSGGIFWPYDHTML